MSRKRVYIAGPLSDGCLADHINAATRTWVRLAKEGFAPFCPHWTAFSGSVALPPGNDDYGKPDDICLMIARKVGHREFTHADYLDMDLAWVSVCHALLRLPGKSKGADIEVEYARRNGIPVFEDIELLCNPGAL